MVKKDTSQLERLTSGFDFSPPDASAIYDPDDPVSLYKKADGDLLECIRDLPEKYKECQDNWLHAKIKVTPILKRLRIAFWREYNWACIENRKMVQRHIFRGICTDMGYRKNIHSMARLGYILRPVRSPKAMMADIHHAGLEKMEIVLEKMNVFDKRGQIIPRNYEIWLKTWQFLHKALYGDHTQKKIAAKVPPSMVPGGETVEDVDARLRKLRSEVQTIEVVQEKPDGQDESPEGAGTEDQGAPVAGEALGVDAPDTLEAELSDPVLPVAEDVLSEPVEDDHAVQCQPSGQEHDSASEDN